MNESRESLKFDFAAPRLAPPVPPPTKQSPRLFITIQEAAELLSFTPLALRKQISRRAFPSGVIVRIGIRTIRFDREKLIEWVRSHEY